MTRFPPAPRMAENPHCYRLRGSILTESSRASRASGESDFARFFFGGLSLPQELGQRLGLRRSSTPRRRSGVSFEPPVCDGDVLGFGGVQNLARRFFHQASASSARVEIKDSREAHAGAPRRSEGGTRSSRWAWWSISAARSPLQARRRRRAEPARRVARRARPSRDTRNSYTQRFNISEHPSRADSPGRIGGSFGGTPPRSDERVPMPEMPVIGRGPGTVRSRPCAHGAAKCAPGRDARPYHESFEMLARTSRPAAVSRRTVG